MTLYMCVCVFVFSYMFSDFIDTLYSCQFENCEVNQLGINVSHQIISSNPEFEIFKILIILEKRKKIPHL